MRTLDDICLSPTDREAIQRAARILRERFPAEAVILFGSKARGDDDPESDIDLLVLTSRPVSPLEKRRMTDALFDIELELAVVISMLVVPRDQWQHGLYQALPIRRRIEREGAAA
jgi:uncharacterized protein